MRRLAYALAMTTAAWCLPAPAAAQPNIIVVMSDDLRHDICALGMTRVCGEIEFGRQYVNAFTTHSVCAPARVSFFTGQTTDQHGIIGEGNNLESRFDLLPEQLEEAGYWTGIYGKDPQGIQHQMHRIGFTDYAVMHPDDSDGGDRYYDATFATPAGDVTLPGYTPEVIGGLCEDAVATAPEPYFVLCTDIAPHAPNTPRTDHVGDCSGLGFPVEGRPSFNEADISDKPSWFDPPLLDANKEDKQREKWRTTCETMIETDKWVRRLARLAGPNTVVIFMSDHGLQFAEHRLTGKNVAFDESIRIPLIVWGGDFAPGVDHRLVSSTDVTATILALAGAVPGPTRPVDPTARDLRGAQRTSVQGTSLWGSNEVQPGPTGVTHWVVEDGWRYFANGPDGGEEMYDLTQDPWQVENLASSPPRMPRQKRYRKMVGRK
jgi:arylsulfatase A-like enzyme